MLAETLYVVIPKQDTFLCIADRSLSRLRGSPLPGADCLGPWSCVGLDCPAGRDYSGPLSRVGASVLMGVAAAALPPVRIWVGCAAWVEAGAWALISR